MELQLFVWTNSSDVTIHTVSYSSTLYRAVAYAPDEMSSSSINLQCSHC